MTIHTSFPRSVLENIACQPSYSSEPLNKDKSNAASCRALHECAEEISGPPGRPYSLTNRLRSLRAAQASRSEQPPTNYQASGSQAQSLSQSSWRSAPTESRGGNGSQVAPAASEASVKAGPRDFFSPERKRSVFFLERSSTHSEFKSVPASGLSGSLTTQTDGGACRETAQHDPESYGNLIDRRRLNYTSKVAATPAGPKRQVVTTSPGGEQPGTHFNSDCLSRPLIERLPLNFSEGEC